MITSAKFAGGELQRHVMAATAHCSVCGKKTSVHANEPCGAQQDFNSVNLDMSHI